MQQYEEDEEGPMPFESAERTSTLQRCRVFNDVPLQVHACTSVLTEVLYLIYRGLVLTTEEATALFFQSTKLLQSTNPRLRRLHYVLMKELSPLVEQSFIASNSLMGDTKSGNDSTKSNALRTLYAVMDKSMYQSMERTIMESMNSRNPNVVTAAFVTGLHIARSNADMPKKWLTQLNEAMKEHSKAQYPAIALLHQLRHNDRLSFSRLMDQANHMIRYPLALCLTVRMGSEVMREDMASAQGIYQFIVRLMQSAENELVMFEAAKALCSMRETMPAALLEPVAKVLAQNLTWSESVGRFAALHMLHQLALIHPRLVEAYNSDIVALVDNSDPVLQTLAIVTLLKTGDDGVLDHLTTQFASDTFLLHLTDRSKMIIVDAVSALHLEQSGRYATLLTFLYRVLTTEGSCELKEKVIATMIRIARSNNGEARDTVLTNLAEFVDDCEFPRIMTRVLTYIGEEVPYCTHPQKLVRYVYNHATLEQAEIRVVAIRTLAKIAARVPSLRASIRKLLRLSCVDADDEVRDRAVLYTRLFAHTDAAMMRTLMDDATAGVRRVREAGGGHGGASSGTDAGPALLSSSSSSFLREAVCPRGGYGPLGKAGHDGLVGNGAAHTAAAADGAGYSSPSVDAAYGGGDATRAAAAAAAGHAIRSDHHADDTSHRAPAAAGALSRAVMDGRAAMRHIRPLRELGAVRHSTEPVLLTESDNEYVVSVLKHVVGGAGSSANQTDGDGPNDYVVLQFRVQNTMDGVAFRQAHVRVNVDDLDGAEARFAIPAARVAPGATRFAYVVLDCGAEARETLFPTGVVESTFCFTTVEVREGAAARAHNTNTTHLDEDEDEETGARGEEEAAAAEEEEAGSEEEFALESFELVVADYITAVDLGSSMLRRRWTELAEQQTAGTYALRSMRNLTTAAHELAQFFGMSVEGGVPEVVERPPYTLFMSGTLADAAGTLILIQAKLFITADNSVALGLTIRGGEERMREYLSNMLLA